MSWPGFATAFTSIQGQNATTWCTRCDAVPPYCDYLYSVALSHARFLTRPTAWLPWTQPELTKLWYRGRMDKASKLGLAWCA